VVHYWLPRVTLAMKSFYSSESTIEVIAADGGRIVVVLPIAGDPSSLGDHVDPAIRAACQTPLPVSEWEKYLASLPAPTPLPEPTLTEKLASIGLTIDQLKEALK